MNKSYKLVSEEIRHNIKNSTLVASLSRGIGMVVTKRAGVGSLAGNKNHLAAENFGC